MCFRKRDARWLSRPPDSLRWPRKDGAFIPQIPELVVLYTVENVRRGPIREAVFKHPMPLRTSHTLRFLRSGSGCTLIAIIHVGLKQFSMS